MNWGDCQTTFQTISRTALAAVQANYRSTTGANALRLMKRVLR